MDKDLLAALDGGNEPEAPIVVSFGESAFAAHVNRPGLMPVNRGESRPMRFVPHRIYRGLIVSASGRTYPRAA
jgi:hypothetical protein